MEVKESSLDHTRFDYIIVKALFVVIVLLRPCLVATAEGTATVRRLAIVSSKEIQESGLSDLLTVRLGQLPPLELVERDLLDKVVQEIALSAMLGAEQPENRRKVGALLNADMLVLLSLERAKGLSHVKVVVSDCLSGARLRSGVVAWDAEWPEGAGDELVGIVNETLERFRSGIKQIIGVSYFVSKNLVHDYDYLQRGYASLLGNALSTLPGVAVTEIAEARAIRLEEALAGDGKIERIVPLFVEGEFEVRRAAAQERPNVHMTIRISDSTGIVKHVEREDLAMDMLGRFLGDEVASEILKLSKAPTSKTLDKDKQFENLTKRAVQFADVGAWTESIDLREASLLLKAHSEKQRTKLMHLYCRIHKPRRAFEHLEYLIYNRLIPIGRAVALSGTCLGGLQNLGYFRVPSWVKAYRRKFMRTTYLEILNLGPSEPARGQQEYQHWYGVLMAQLWPMSYGLGCGSKEDLDFCIHVHESVLPEGLSPSETFIRFLHIHVGPTWRKTGIGVRDKGAFGIQPNHFSRQEFLAFVTTLSKSKRPLNSFYGRYALWNHQCYTRQKQGVPVTDLLAEAELLIDEIRQLKFPGGNKKEMCKEMERRIRAIKNSAQQ